MGLSGPVLERLLRLMDPKDRAALGKVGMTAEEAFLAHCSRTERTEQRLFANELLRRGLPYVWHRTDRRSAATLGTPDFIVGIASQTLWIEFKAPSGVLSVEQTKFRDRLTAERIPLHICRDAAEAIKLIKDVLRG